MKILFGISAGISIYKIPTIIRMLRKKGHTIRVVMTPNATRMVSPIIFKTVTEEDVYIEDFSIKDPLAHIRLGDWADLLVLIPATANTIAKVANGIADNLLTSVVLAFEGKKMVFPAMNVKMYENQATQENLNKLRRLNFKVVEPASGELACGYSGRGRLPSEEAIVGLIDRDIEEPLKGLKFIVTAGGTIERIDPVRYISNFSSGKMAFEIATYLFKKGADVLIVRANTSITAPDYISSICVESAREMLEVLKKNLQSFDGLYMVAAPADFRALDYSERKIKSGELKEIKVTSNPDIVKEIRKEFKEKFIVGFALETQDFEANAIKKLKEKGLNFIVLNPLTPQYNPMGGDRNSIILYSRDGKVGERMDSTKKEVAEYIVEETLKAFVNRGR